MSNPIKPFDAADLRKLLATASNRFTELNDDGLIPAFSEMELKGIILQEIGVSVPFLSFLCVGAGTKPDRDGSKPDFFG